MQLDMAVLLSVDPDAVRRAQRLRCAINMLEAGLSEREVRRQIIERFELHRVTAHKVVQMARDLALVAK